MNWLLGKVLNAFRRIGHRHDWLEEPGPNYRSCTHLWRIKKVCQSCGSVHLSGNNLSAKYRDTSYWIDQGYCTWRDWQKLQGG